MLFLSSPQVVGLVSHPEKLFRDCYLSFDKTFADLSLAFYVLEIELFFLSLRESKLDVLFPFVSWSLRVCLVVVTYKFFQIQCLEFYALSPQKHLVIYSL